jgi:hypothetical protein
MEINFLENDGNRVIDTQNEFTQIDWAQWNYRKVENLQSKKELDLSHFFVMSKPDHIEIEAGYNQREGVHGEIKVSWDSKPTENSSNKNNSNDTKDTPEEKETCNQRMMNCRDVLG